MCFDSVGVSLFHVESESTTLMYVVSFGKESRSRSLSMISMLHVLGRFFWGRRGGEIGDGGSSLLVFVLRVGEFNVSGS